MAGQIVMQGFIHRTIPLAVRRGVTMAPALIVLAIGIDPSRALVISQVVLSFGIPFALVPLLLVCRDRNVMGPLVNARVTTILATIVAVVIISLNAFLLEQTFFSLAPARGALATWRRSLPTWRRRAPLGTAYETLVREVADSLTWRRFCRSALDGRVPDSTTLMELTDGLGPGLLEKLDAELLKVEGGASGAALAAAAVNATVVESDTRYPTDSGLCAHAVRRLTAAAGEVHDAGLARRCGVRDRHSGVAKRIRWISAALSRVGRSREAVDALTDGDRARAGDRARGTPRAAQRRSRRTRRRAPRRTTGRPAGARAGGRGADPGPDCRAAARQALDPNRRVSLVDADASPVPSGRRYRPHQFGCEARVADTAESLLICEIPSVGNPPDDALLGGALDRAIDAGMRVETVFADRGFSTPAARDELARRGITDIVIPARDWAGPREQTRAWRRRYRFRNGIEGRISQAKRHGLRRTRLRGLAGAQDLGRRRSP